MKEELIAVQVTAVDAFLQQHHRTYQIQRTFGTTEKFVTLVYKKHESQIERWGDWQVMLRSTDVGYVHANTVGAVWRALRWWHRGSWQPLLHPGFFSRQTWEKADATVQVTPTLAVKFRKGQGVSRAVLKAVKDPGEIDLWQRFFSQMGDQWAALTHPKLEISCAPISFLRLGHMGEDSCYRFGGGYEHSKFHLAQIPGSFVGLLYKKTTSLQPDGRFWGVLGKDGAVVTNHYRFSWQAYQSLIRRALSEEVGKSLRPEPISHYSNPIQEKLHARWAYVNAGAKILTPPKKRAQVLQQVAENLDRFLAKPHHYSAACY